MTTAKGLPRVFIAVLLCWLTANPTPTAAQNQKPKQEQSDVVRVYTELVQTDVMVFNKQGEFVNNLRREDFELRIDGKPRPIEFFERITAGSVNEEAQLAAARGSLGSSKTGVVPLDRGRTIFFYVDDMHMDLSGVSLTRKMISQFIEKEMGQNDEAAITSSSGQIGFLGQLTDNHAVLKAALERLRPRSSSVSDLQSPPMSEYQALMISRYDRDTTDFFVEQLMREIPMLSRDSALHMVTARAQAMLLQAANVSRVTLSGLESLVRSSQKLPGRKIVFFVSNGFFIDTRNSDSTERIQKLTSAAARSGVVIYSMDSRGLVASLTDASSQVAFDPSGRLQRGALGELSASQDAMNAIARDTGGRPFFNTNALDIGLKKALDETATYYLLAWKPDPESQTNGRFRKIDVKLVSKSNDYTVRVRRGFFEVDPEAAGEDKKKNKVPEKKTPEIQLRETINAAFPAREIPIFLSLAHMNDPAKGELLSSALQIPGEFLTFGADSDPSKAVVDIAGFVFDSQGRVGARFDDRVSITAPPRATPETKGKATPRDFTYNFPIYLSPGLYQVRVGARDLTSGRAGSAHAWIEIPNVKEGQLALSSLLMGERGSSNLSTVSTANTSPTDQVNLSVSKRFHRDSFLRFLVFVYNPAKSADAKPDAVIQMQVVRDGHPVVTTAQRKVDPDGSLDRTRLPYAAEIPLADLPPGRYLLNVTVLDRVSKKTASQQSRFEIY